MNTMYTVTASRPVSSEPREYQSRKIEHPFVGVPIDVVLTKFDQDRNKVLTGMMVDSDEVITASTRAIWKLAALIWVEGASVVERTRESQSCTYRLRHRDGRAETFMLHGTVEPVWFFGLTTDERVNYLESELQVLDALRRELRDQIEELTTPPSTAQRIRAKLIEKCSEAQPDVYT